MTEFKLDGKAIRINNSGVDNWLGNWRRMRMSVQKHNPFKVGDKVKLLNSSYDFNPRLWDAYDGYKWGVVTEVFNEQLTTHLDDTPTHYSHFELYKEEKDMTQQTQQKTKRVPFTHELWEKWKDNGGKVIYERTGQQVLQLSYFPEAHFGQRYVYLLSQNCYLSMTDGRSLQLEIPVTTKRVPFNPELKDAKVFTTLDNQQIVDWVMFKDGQVACQWPNAYMGYYPTRFLEMEIEE